MITVRAPPYLIRVARHILSIQALQSLEWYSWRDSNPQNFDPKSNAYANSATGTYEMGVCHYFSPARMPTYTLLPLRLGCDKNFIFTTFKDT